MGGQLSVSGEIVRIRRTVRIISRRINQSLLYMSVYQDNDILVTIFYMSTD